MRSGTNQQQVFDPIRGIWVKATPEEIVRQTILQKMIHQWGYPRELIAVEKQIGELIQGAHAAIPLRRIDIVCFKKRADEGLDPLLLIECKDERLSQKALDQIIGYNSLIKAPFLSVVARTQTVIGRWDPLIQSYHFQKGFPSYLELVEYANVVKPSSV